MTVGAKVFEIFGEGADRIDVSRDLIDGLPDRERLMTAPAHHVKIAVVVTLDHECYFTSFIESQLLEWKREGILTDNLKEARADMYSRQHISQFKRAQ